MTDTGDMVTVTAATRGGPVQSRADDPAPLTLRDYQAEALAAIRARAAAGTFPAAITKGEAALLIGGFFARQKERAG